MVSDAQLLRNSAVVVAKIIRHNNPATNTSTRKDGNEEEGEKEGPVVSTTTTGAKVTDSNNDEGQDVIGTAVAVIQKLTIEDSDARNEDVDKETNDEQMNEVSGKVDENIETSTESVDKTMEEDLSATFLYRSYYDVNSEKPDFLSYRLPLMFLAIKNDPYFFKVNKIRFKPYGCDNEMEFIQIQWPIQLNELYQSPKYTSSNHKGWSGPMFNKWATRNNFEEEAIRPSVDEPASPSETMSHDGDDEKGEDHDDDDSYHRAYIQAELKPKSESTGNGFSDSTRGFNIVITALVGGVWNLEDDPYNYTCQHLAEMRTAQEEIVREIRTKSYHTDYFYKRVRMLSNYWQCYLAGETNYLVGVNGPISSDPRQPDEEKTNKGRQINEVRLYDVSKIPDFIKKCGAEQGFRPWSKEILQNRLYKSLTVIYDKVKDAPVDTEFMFVKYDVFDPPIHDVDGCITGPYLLAFKQLIIEGLPTPSQPNLLTKIMLLIEYAKFVKIFLDRKIKREDVPKQEEKGDCIILTFPNELLQEVFLHRVDSMLKYMKENDKFPADCGLENLSIKQVFMERPVKPRGNNNSQSWRSSDHRQQQTTLNRMQTQPVANTQSWRSSTNQQPESSTRNYENNWRHRDSAVNNVQSWRSSSHQQQQPNIRNNNWRQEAAPANFREQTGNNDDNRRQRYGGRVNDEQNWRRK